jgi:hypothetical protein
MLQTPIDFPLHIPSGVESHTFSKDDFLER